MSEITESAILHVLDEAQRYARFPLFESESHWLHGSCRFLAFRGPEQWLLTIEHLFYNVTMKVFTIDVFVYGNKSTSNLAPDAPYLEPIQTTPQSPFFDDNDNPILDLFDFEIAVNGTIRRFQPTVQDYAALGIDTSVFHRVQATILRYLIHLFGYSLFPPIDSVAQFAGTAYNNLHLLVRRDEWPHTAPDFPEGYEWYQSPSEVRFFRELARAIEMDDPHFPFSPDPPNTHCAIGSDSKTEAGPTDGDVAWAFV